MFSMKRIVLGALFVFLVINESECQTRSNPAPECFSPPYCKCCKPEAVCQSGGRCNDNCKNGYHGGKCINRCPENCVSCKDAPTGGGVAKCTQCKDGHYSTNTLYQCQLNCSFPCKTCESSITHCTSCPIGYYLTSGYTCNACAEGCKECSSSGTCSSCDVGYFLDSIQNICQRCNLTCFSCDSDSTCICSIGCKDNKCEAASGNCTFGCTNGFRSPKCDICAERNHGVNCDKVCPINCSGQCHRFSGKCTSCKEGFYGQSCEDQCPVNCLDNTCNHDNGQCEMCKDSFYGVNCTSECAENCKKCKKNDGECDECEDGQFGINCRQNCSENCASLKCDRWNGSCSCIPEYEGSTCQIKVTSRAVTFTPVVVVITENPQKHLPVTIGGALGGAVFIALFVGLVIFFYRKKHRKPMVSTTAMGMDAYKFDSRLTDVLEENDEFDPIYFTGQADLTVKPCGKLPVKELTQFVDSRGDDYFQEEFLRLPRGLIKPFEDAKKEENIVKNRYNGIYPYDEHRVRLHPPGSDFINACYIDGINRKKEYIASLGPTNKAMQNFVLFWRMVWQEKPDVIVMVTNLMEGTAMKCEQYWPSSGETLLYGDVQVTLRSEEMYAEFVVRPLIVSKGGERRELHHIHYTAWPDKRVPDDITSLIELRQKVKSIKPVLGGPTIVHCSAGIGRTGTYIALDTLVQQGKVEKSLDIFDWVNSMRQQRTSMVQTEKQYEYLHRALVHALTYHCEPIKSKKFQHVFNNMDAKKITRMFKQLDRRVEKLPDHEIEARETNKGFVEQNREGADIPGNQHKPLLHFGMMYGEVNYINAVFINSYRIKNRFLIAQTPLPSTVKDFLTLVMQEKCSCIVSMDPPIADRTIGEYYSPENGGVVTHPSYVFDVETQELDSNSSYILRKLTVHFHLKAGSTSRSVYHYECQHWSQNSRVPDVYKFLQLVQDVEVMADRDVDHGPVIVHCLNAAERSGLFCAVSNLIQKMGLEGEVSVVNTLRQIKVRRAQVIPNKEQYAFCYQSVLQWIKSESEQNDQPVYGNLF